MDSLGGLVNSSEIIPTYVHAAHIYNICLKHPCLSQQSPHLGLDFKMSATAIQGTVVPSSLCLPPPHARPPPNVANL